MQKAIIHTDTRVIKRLTTDESPVLTKDETIVELVENIDLAGGSWKLDNANKKVLATAKEIEDSGDEQVIFTKRSLIVKEINKAISDIAQKGATLENIQEYFKLLEKLS